MKEYKTHPTSEYYAEMRAHRQIHDTVRKMHNSMVCLLMSFLRYTGHLNYIEDHIDHVWIPFYFLF